METVVIKNSKPWGFFVETIINGEPRVTDNVDIRHYSTEGERDSAMQEYKFTHEDTKDQFQLTPFKSITNE